MSDPLKQIDQFATQCQLQIATLLSDRHKVRLVKGENAEKAPSGAAFFFVFDPWNTCLRMPTGAAKYFDTAVRQELIDRDDAIKLIQKLVSHCWTISQQYDGRFSNYFRDPLVKFILSRRDRLSALIDSGPPFGSTLPDLLFQACPWPFLPARYRSSVFQKVTAEEELLFYSQSPWLAWIEALDLICLGPWLGFKADEIIDMVDSLDPNRGAGKPVHSVMGEKIVFPLFSHGLQGVVVGFFRNISETHGPKVLKILEQFGQTLGDNYSAFRIRSMFSKLREDLDEKNLAMELINLLSPINKIIVTRNGRSVGFKIIRESDLYWAGYESLNSGETAEEVSEFAVIVNGPAGASICVEPLTEVPGFDLEFARMRIETTLVNIFNGQGRSKTRVLPLGDVKELYDIFGEKRQVGTSLANLRQFYIVSKVADNWTKGGVHVSNRDLKRFLENELKRPVSGGYQVTSFAPEVEKLFDKKVAVKKERNFLSLSWNPDR